MFLLFCAFELDHDIEHYNMLTITYRLNTLDLQKVLFNGFVCGLAS